MKTNYYLISKDDSENQCQRHFDSYKALVDFYTPDYFEQYSKYRSRHELSKIFEYFGHSFNEVRIDYNYHYNSETDYYVKSEKYYSVYIIKDDFGRVVNLPLLLDDIWKNTDKVGNSRRRKRYHCLHKHGDVIYPYGYGYSRRRFNNRSIRFRQDPVPGISNGRRYGMCFRSTGGTPRRAKAESLEHINILELSKKSRIVNYALWHDAWDDYDRSDFQSRSWKNKKRKKQWMK